MKRLAILAPGLTGPSGHEGEYTAMIADAAKALGVDVEIVCPPGSTALTFPHRVRTALLPLAPPKSARNLWQRAVRKAETALVQQQRLEAYSKLFREGAPDLVWLLHTASYDEIGIAVRAFAQGGVGEFAVMLRYDHYDDPLAIAQLKRALEPTRASNIRLYADSEDLRALLTPLAPTPITVAPPPALTPPENESPRAPRIGYFGAMRRQKGFHHLPAIVEATRRADPEIGFIVQAYRHSADPPDKALDDALNWLRRQDGIELIEDTLSSEDYHKALWSCTAVVAAYDPFVYRAGTSGVFSGAVAANAAVLTSPNTWMAREAERVGLSRIYVLPEDAREIGAVAVRSAREGPAPRSPRERAWLEASAPKQLVRNFLAVA